MTKDKDEPTQPEGITYSETLILEARCAADSDQIIKLVYKFNDEQVPELNKWLPVQLLGVSLKECGNGYLVMGRVIGHQDIKDPKMIRPTGPMGEIRVTPLSDISIVQIISYVLGIDWNMEYFKTLSDYILKYVDVLNTNPPDPRREGWDKFWKWYFACPKEPKLKELSLHFNYEYQYVRNMKSKYKKKYSV